MIALENAAVLDVRSGELLPDRTVIVEGGTIRSVGNGKAPADARRIDVAGRTVMPGLCDAHVHVTALTPDFAELGRLSPAYVTAHSARILDGMLSRGFTTVRDAGGADHGLARALREGLLPGPNLLFCGKAISQTGGHGDMRAPGEHQVSPCGCCAGLGRIVDGVAEMRRACRDTIRQGATHIKLMMSGGVSSPTDRISSTQLAMDEIVAAVEEAEAAEIYCMAHAYTPRAIQRAVSAGVRSIEHGNLLDAETAALMAAKGAFLVPTLVTYHALANDHGPDRLPPDMCEKLATVRDAGLAAIEIARDAGVTMAFGSDLLGAMHDQQLQEFVLRAEVLAPIEVIRSATLNAARLFQREGRIGEIAEGADADLLVIEGNPLDRLDVLTTPETHLKLVMIGGRIKIDRL